MTARRHDTTESPERYRGMDRAAIDLAYDNAAAFPDVSEWRDRWHDRTQTMRMPPGAVLDIPYGPDPLQKIDIFPVSDPAAPTALFFHGGFWSRNGKDTFRFLVDAIHRCGFNAAFAGYALAPTGDFGIIVRDATLATRWLVSHLSEHGLAQHPLVLIGWSAGAHLVALQMEEPGVAAGMAISGIYDLEPMRIGSMNAILQLDAAAVANYSPARLQRRRSAPLLISYGARELAEFRRQSVDFHAAWHRQSLPVSLVSLHDHHHHSVLEELHAPSGHLAAQLTRLKTAVMSHRSSTHD